MPRRLPPLNAVRAFEAAGRHVSFTRAATELEVTHGAVSRQVALLEEWLGAPLFRRTSSQLTLTDAGRAYLAEATAALDRLAAAALPLTDQAAPVSLHVSGPPTFTMRWLLSRMSAFQRRRPDIEIRLTTSLAPVDFLEHSYDIAIRGAPGPATGCISRPIMTELVVPVCHVDMVENGRLSRPRDLAKETLISYRTEPYPWAEWLELAGEPELAPAATLDFEEMYFALQAALEGLGVVLVPLFLAIDEIVAGRLCTPFGRLGAKHRQYYASAAQASPAVDAFCEWLLEEGRETERAMSKWAEAVGARRADMLPL